jgi:sulfur carrier protein ThiS
MQCQVHSVGQPYNWKAEVNLKAAFQKAGPLSPRHFAVKNNRDVITENYSKVQATKRSGTNDDQFCEGQYVMQQLHLRYSCCTCPDAVQQSLSKHQADELMLLYPVKRPARQC